MEFMDPIVAEEEISELPKNSKPHDEGKTEQNIHQLEQEITNAYDAVEKRFGDLWSSASKNADDLQQKYHLEQRKNEVLKQLNSAKANINDKAKVSDHLAQFELQFKSLKDQVHLSEMSFPEIDFQKLNEQTSSYLDSLDNRLEQVEKQAGKYVNQFASFLSGMVSVNNGDSSTEQTFTDEKELQFPSSLRSAANYGTSRYDSELFKLHTSPEMFLNDKLDEETELKAFNVEDKTETISELLEKYDATLRKVMNEIVPVKISYPAFWYRYFKLEADLKLQDEKRRKLLQTKKQKTGAEDEEEEEDFTWDDDEDEEGVVDVAKEVKQPSDKPSANKSEVTSAATEEDDDWE